jgi:hypothetical protein
VPGVGFEPTPSFEEGGLSPPCLPIPPPGQHGNATSRAGLGGAAHNESCNSRDRPGDVARRANRFDAAQLPQVGAQAVGVGWLKAVGCDDSLDHVRQNGRPWSATQSDRDDHTVVVTADRAIDPDQPWRAPEAGPDQASPARLTRERTGG